MATWQLQDQCLCQGYVRCWLVKAWVSEPLTGKWRQDDSKGLDQSGLIAGSGQSQLTTQLHSGIAMAENTRRGRWRVAILLYPAVLSYVHPWNWRFTMRARIYVDVCVRGPANTTPHPLSAITNSKKLKTKKYFLGDNFGPVSHGGKSTNMSYLHFLFIFFWCEFSHMLLQIY